MVAGDSFFEGATPAEASMAPHGQLFELCRVYTEEILS